MSNLEIEARVVLSQTERTKMLAFMEALGNAHRIARVAIDFSGPQRVRTVTLSINDGEQTLVAKTGALADTVRQEARLELPQDTPLDRSLGYLAIMGYDRGMVSLRHLTVATVDGLEYSVRDIISPRTGWRASTLLEIEASDVNVDNQDAAHARIEKALLRHGLTELTAHEWEAWVEKIYREVDEPFTYSPGNVAKLEAALVRLGFLPSHSND